MVTFSPVRATRAASIFTAVVAAFLSVSVTAAPTTPASITLDNDNRMQTFTGAPITGANVTPASGSHVCTGSGVECDNLNLTVDTSNFPANNVATLRVSVAWDQLPEGQDADLDIYLVDAASGDTLTSAASAANPEVMTFPVPATGGSYTVDIVPFLAASTTYTGSVSLTLTEVSSGGGGGGGGGESAPAMVDITDPQDGDTIAPGSDITVTGTFTPEMLDTNGDGFVVIGVADSGINPYHEDFAASTYDREGIDGATLFSQHPSTYLAGYPTSAPALELTIDGNYNADSPADAAAFQAVASNQVYWIPGTKIIGAYDTGASSGVTGAPDDVPVLDEDGHGTGSASVAVGNIYGSCKTCLLVVAEGLSEEWVLSQDWIDISSNSFGAIGNIGTPVLSSEAATKAATERGQSVLYAAGNGNANAFLTPQQTYLPNTTGPDWTMTVGAIHNNNFPAEGNSAIIGSGKPVDISSFGLGNIPAACFNNADGDCGHSGTSAATPITAGHLGKIIETARELLGDTNRIGAMRVGGDGPEGRGVVATGTPVADNAFLSDGEFTRAEAWHILYQSASPLTEDPIGFNNIQGYGLGATPVDYAYTGYGVADANSQEKALLMLTNGDAMRRDTSEADDFFATDKEIRDALWGAWDSDVDTIPAADSGTSQLADLGIEATDVPSDVDGFLNVYASDAEDDGIVPGVAGEAIDMIATQDGDFAEFELVVGPLDNAVPTILGNPVTYQAEFSLNHNGLQLDYTATYRNEIVPTEGILPNLAGDPETFEITVLSAPNATGLRSLCPTPISTEGSRTTFDEQTGFNSIIWRVPLAEFTENTIADQGACEGFERNGDGLEAGDLITGITGTAILRVATITFSDFQDTATTDNLTITGAMEEEGCPTDQLVLSIADIEKCIAFDPQLEGDFAESLGTAGLAEGDYALTATVFSGLTTVATDSIDVTFGQDDGNNGGGNETAAPGQVFAVLTHIVGADGHTVMFDASDSYKCESQCNNPNNQLALEDPEFTFFFRDDTTGDIRAATVDPDADGMIVHEYGAAGEFTPFVVVRDANGNSDSASNTVVTTIEITAGDAPAENAARLTASFDEENPTVPLTVIFDASQSTTADGFEIVSYTFDFDDGSTFTRSEAIVQWVYTSAATYEPTVTVNYSKVGGEDDVDATSTAKSRAVQAVAAPPAGAGGDDTPTVTSSGGGSGGLGWLLMVPLALAGLRRRRR